MYLFMKHPSSCDTVAVIKSLRGSFQVVEREAGGRHYISVAFTYLFNTRDARDPELFINTIYHLRAMEMEENIMTIAQQFEARGIEQGREKERKSIALKLAQQGMSVEQVAGLTELALARVRKLYKTSRH